MLPVSEASAATAQVPPLRQNDVTGSTARYLLSGDWLQRKDPSNKGQKAGWFRSASTGGWKAVTVPQAFNAGDSSAASQAGTYVWYRKDFRVPSSAKGLNWVIQFESVRYRADVYLNGRLMASSQSGYLPFEVRLTGVDPKGVNRLVVRVDNHRRDTDLPARTVQLDGAPGGGWWNYGGILDDVYLRKVDRLDFGDPVVRPLLDCRTCAARIEYSVPVTNVSAKALRTTVDTSYGGQPLNLGTRNIGPGQTLTFKRTLTLAAPHLWSPADPFLYPVAIDAKVGGRALAGYRLESGVRSIGVVNGRLYVNHMPADLRGGFVHVDEPGRGAAASVLWEQQLLERLKSTGGTVLRTHYPFPPSMHELADRMGVFLWSEIPVYQLPSKTLNLKIVRDAALADLRSNVTTFQNHPSVLTWSLANELNPQPGQAETRYFNAGTALVKQLDPTRPVSIVTQGYPTQGQQAAYAPFDMIGVNDYFGWYPGPGGTIADRDQLSQFMDAFRSWYPTKAVMITEFGAEGNRPGPFEERGTYDFQTEWMNFHLQVYATKPWLSGAIAMFQEFWCRPGWTGGNPRPQPPLHQKGIYDYLGNAKPAAALVSDWFHRTQQIDIPEGQ
jgi:beta-glucuronidase